MMTNRKLFSSDTKVEIVPGALSNVTHSEMYSFLRRNGLCMMQTEEGFKIDTKENFLAMERGFSPPSNTGCG